MCQDSGPDPYPPRATRDLLAKNPCAASRMEELKDVQFSSEMAYMGHWRETPPALGELVRTWARSLKIEEPKFPAELNIRDGGDSWWALAPEPVEDYLKRRAKVGDRVVLYMSYAGCSAGRPVLVIEDVGRPAYEDLEDEAETYVA